MRKYFQPLVLLFFYHALFIPYSVNGNPSFSTPKFPSPDATNPRTTAPQIVDIRGKVISSEDQSPIPGVSVILKGSTIGTSTDASGNFNIQVPSTDAVLVFSSVGFVSQETVVGTRTVVEISLETDQKSLSEVVVVGYGTQKKSQLTGAISSVGAKEIGELPITNARQALQGRVAGVDVVQNGSNPGAGVSVRIRGRRSINASNDPLYVVDGIPMAGSIDDINPNDIASMEILKDASATAIYGSRGANGVVIVTTKRGTSGRMVVSYDGYYGISKELNRIDVMNGTEFAEYKRESRRAVGTYDDSDPTAADLKLFTAVELEGIAEGRSTDYQNEILRTGSIQSHQIGIQGGSEKTQFAVSSNYFKDKGIIKTMDFTRYSLRINLDHRISKNIRIGISSLGVYSVNNGASSFRTSSNGFTPLALTLRENPLGKAYNDDGTLIFLPTADGLQSNPASEVVNGNNIAETETIRLFNSIYAEWNILPHLKYRFNFGPDFTVQSFGRYWGTNTNDRRGGDPRALLDKGRRFNYTLENVLTYAKVFNQKHDLNITALHSVQQDNYQTSGISVTGLPVESMSYHNLGAASSISSVSSALTEWALQSFMARVNYSFQEKYLFTVTGRYDGSSRFGVNTKYGFFPSAAVGWNISDENFLKTISWVSQLKLRASWGKTGNTAIDPYQTQTLLSRSAYAYLSTAAYGYAPSTIGNADLRWESTASTNFGLDYAFLNNRLSGSIEYYISQTSDLLLQDNLPGTSGYSYVFRNVGKTQNQGIEISLSTINIDKGDFKWTTDIQWTKNNEKIVELANGKEDDIGNSRFIGQPITAIYDYKKLGIWQLSEADEAASYSRNVGDIKVADLNNDGKIDADNDRTIIGSQIPDFTAGITNRFSYKNIDFSFFIFTRVGSTITSSFHSDFNTLAGRYNNLDIDYWTPTNPTDEFPRPNVNQESPLNSSTLRYFSGTFLKVRNINLGYNVPEAMTQKMKISSLRLYLAAQQPFNFSKYRSQYKGIDNETFDSIGSSQSYATRQFIIGANVKF